MNPLVIKIIAGLLIISASFFAGWRVKGAFVAERDLSIAEAKKAFQDAQRENEAHISTLLEDKLSQLRANERIVNNEVLKIIDRPVYLNECLDVDGLQSIERARTGKADTSKPSEEVPASK